MGLRGTRGTASSAPGSWGIPQIDDAVKQMGISEEDLDMLSDEMSSVFGPNQPEEDEVGSQTALPSKSAVQRRRAPPGPAGEAEQGKEREEAPKSKPKSINFSTLTA